MSGRYESEKQLWADYAKLYQKHPRPDSQAMVDFYSKNSDYITRNSQNPNPEIAIIIPAHDERKYLARTLASINSALMAYEEKNVSTIVVDNASTDGTGEIARAFGAQVIYEPNKGVGQARQTGLETTSKSVRFVLTTDADTIIPGNWIKLHHNSLNQENIVCTHGGFKYLVENSADSVDKFIYFIYQNSVHTVRALKRKPDPLTIGGSNTGFRKDIALLCGGYDRNLTHGEDMDIIRKMSLLGDIVRIDSQVITSARRIFGEGVWPRLISSVRHNLPTFLGGLEPPPKQFNNQFIDYR